MRKGIWLLGFTVVAGVAAVSVPRVPEWLTRVAWFEVTEVVVEGVRYLDPDTIRAQAALPEGFSIWGDLEGVQGRVRAHAGVADARVRRRIPGSLVVEVREREPVALLPTPALVPVDVEGRILPIDPTRHRLDLPLLRPRVELLPGPAASVAPSGDAGLTPSQLQLLASAVASLVALEPRISATLSEASVDPHGDIVIRFIEPATTIHYRPPLTAERLMEGWIVLADALDRQPNRLPTAIDLRFADQVVVRYPTPTRR
jgi:hypothetical protein